MGLNTLQMEIALMKECNFRQNIVVSNVSFGIVRYFYNEGKRCYDELHECDILKVTLTGYATEFEIKVSKSDFKADAKKKHSHDSKFIKQLYYAIPFEMLDFAKENLPYNSGLVYVKNNKVIYDINAPVRNDAFKWTQDELFKLARLGTMRISTLKSALAKNI